MARDRPTERSCCAPKPNIEQRPLMDRQQATDLEAVFKVLANVTRVRLLHALIRQPDMCVGDLARALGMNPPAVSNQLRLLTDRGIVTPRRKGNNISYRIIDPCIVSLLDQGLCLTEDLPRSVRLVAAAGGGLDKRVDFVR